MKITRTSESTRAERPQPNTNGASRTPTAGAQTSASAGGQASAQATRLNELETQFSGSTFDASKVSDIRDAIAAGRYQVDAGVVADKLLASAAQLAGLKA